MMRDGWAVLVAALALGLAPAIVVAQSASQALNRVEALYHEGRLDEALAEAEQISNAAGSEEAEAASALWLGLLLDATGRDAVAKTLLEPLLEVQEPFEGLSEADIVEEMGEEALELAQRNRFYAAKAMLTWGLHRAEEVELDPGTAWSAQRCCQTNANSSRFRQVALISGGTECPPLSESGGAVRLVDVAAEETPV